LVARLANWPQVSGVKRLTGNLAGKCRLRTGDYRLQFEVSAKKITVKETKVVAGKEVVEEKEVRQYTVTIEKAGHRDGFYEE
jgi:mRNA-degrading endonuclease RelE of RelBE toxin-antitoxin system